MWVNIPHMDGMAYKLVTMSPPWNSWSRRVTYLFVSNLAEIEAPKKAVSIFWGQLWTLLGGTVRLFSTTIQVVFFFRKLETSWFGTVGSCWLPLMNSTSIRQISLTTWIGSCKQGMILVQREGRHCPPRNKLVRLSPLKSSQQQFFMSSWPVSELRFHSHQVSWIHGWW